MHNNIINENYENYEESDSSITNISSYEILDKNSNFTSYLLIITRYGIIKSYTISKIDYELISNDNFETKLTATDKKIFNFMDSSYSTIFKSIMKIDKYFTLNENQEKELEFLFYRITSFKDDNIYMIVIKYEEEVCIHFRDNNNENDPVITVFIKKNLIFFK